MSLVVMGISHKTASIDARQCAAIPEAAMHDALHELVSAPNVKEAVVLSTCNRVEAYVEAKTDGLGASALERFFHGRVGDAFDAHDYYLHRGIDAVQHVLRVVSSLDSQVLGEAQILGQMRGAFETAQEAGTSIPRAGARTLHTTCAAQLWTASSRLRDASPHPSAR